MTSLLLLANSLVFHFCSSLDLLNLIFEFLYLTFISSCLLLRLRRSLLTDRRSVHPFLIGCFRRNCLRMRLLILLDSFLCSLLLNLLHILAADIANTYVISIDKLFELFRLEVLLDHMVVRESTSFDSKA